MNISNKFKEIKSLAIEYKKDKDVEISNLNKELEKFSKTIEENNIHYEAMLDKTTKSLEKIISNKSIGLLVNQTSMVKNKR